MCPAQPSLLLTDCPPVDWSGFTEDSVLRESLVCGAQTSPSFLLISVILQAKTLSLLHINKMALLNFPIPDLDVTLQEVNRVLQLVLSPDLYSEFQSSVERQREVLQEVHQKFATVAKAQENWVTEIFKRCLLSCDDPLPTSTALPFVLLPSQAKQCSQLGRAAALLWAAAKLHSEPCLLEGGTSLECTQQSELFAATRIPGRGHDEIKVYPNSTHAIVICGGGVFPIDIMSRPCDGGALSARSLRDIYDQLASVMDQPRAAKENDPSVICGLSALGRKAWASSREEILEQGGDIAASLGLMERALLALCLDESNAPPDMAAILNALKLGGGGKESPGLRYYDKVLNVVVFKDGTAGMLFEHSAVDGMVACLVAHCVYTLSETSQLNLLHNTTENTNGPSKEPSDIALPAPLMFPLNNLNMPKSCPDAGITQQVLSFHLTSYPDAFSAVRGQRGLFDAWINFSLQLSLRETFGEAAANRFLIVTPTHMRHYKHGRCDPTYSVTAHSRKLVDALASYSGSENITGYTTDLLHMFHVAFMEHKRLIKNTKKGQGVGPHIATLRQSLPSDNPLKKHLDHFRCPPVYITGTDVMEPVECLVGNVYAPDQLAVGYLWRRDKVCIVLNGNGKFSLSLGELQKGLKKNLELVMLLAVQHAIAHQMGALESIFKQGQPDKKDGEMNHWQENSNHHKGSEGNSDYTLVIHGGAGEDLMLNTKEIELIEFALETALTVGSQMLQNGGSSLDAVQRSVEALENCFLFNAGKGSVLNKDGNHEMEASIVDGNDKRSGSVACLQSAKNPVKAARCVMEESSHSLIVGEGAEEFLRGLEEKQEFVAPEYFYTDVRHRELIAKLSHANPSKNNHPQTVGAVAVDRFQKLAAASSTGGLVGKLKGRVGDTAVVGAGIYADQKVALTCSGDGDVFLRHTVAQKIASLHHHKGDGLRQACREVMAENLNGTCAGIIAVDAQGDAVIETNAGVMFVASVVQGISRVEVLRPMTSHSNVIWESDDLVAYLNPRPWTPGSSILTRKTLSGASSIFQLALPDFVAMLQGARAVSNLLCERLGVQRCALVFKPTPGEPAHVRILPLHGLEPKWQPHLNTEEEFHAYSPGYCTSKAGPRWEDDALAEVQAKIRNGPPNSAAECCFDFFGDASCDDLFSRIVRGEQQQWRVWEDDQHVAFLTPFPNSPGFTVMVPRKPLTSDIFKLDEADYKALVSAAYKVAKLLEKTMETQSVALMFEGFEIDYAHVKLIPLLPCPDGSIPAQLRSEFYQNYPGFVSSLDGPAADPRDIEKLRSKITLCHPPHSWEDPDAHSMLAINNQWYRNLFRIQNTLFHSTVEYFHASCQYSYALTPITSDTISSPMGLGSDSEPVSVNLLGQDVYLADSMQFVLEYFLRFQENLPGVYYISPSFRGEDPDATHLNQFYHVECELLGGFEKAMTVAEMYLAHLTKSMLKKHSDVILNAAGTLAHVTALINKLDGKSPLPKIPLDEAIAMMPSADCVEWVQDGQPQYGRKLTRTGERFLIKKYGGVVWLTEMDHLGVPFYQAYVEGTDQKKAKAADLLLGLGETVGLGERHFTPETVEEALRQHAVQDNSYKWYINMRQVKPLRTSGWGMGSERYLCWLLQHDDIRDVVIIPRMKGIKYMP